MRKPIVTRLFMVLLAVLLLLPAVPAATAAESDFEIDGNTLVRYKGSDEEVVVPEGIEILGEGAFDSSSLVKKIVLPESLKEIGNYCFFGARGLEEITIPASVTKVGGTQVFTLCPSLKAICVEEGNENYVSVDGVLFTKDLSTLLYYPDGRTADVYEIPAGTVSVNYTAFSRATIGKIVIPASATDMPEDALDDVVGLREIEVGEGHPSFISRDGVLCSADGKTVYCFPSLPDKEELAPEDFPEGIGILGTASFSGCPYRKITLPDTVKKIGWRAFAGSETLEEIFVPASVEEIEGRAFEACPELKTICILNANVALDQRENRCIVDQSGNTVILTTAGGTLEQYCADNGIACFASEGSAEELLAKYEGEKAEIEKQLEEARLAAEEEAHEAELLRREKEYEETLEERRKAEQEADKAWTAAWPPKGKTEAAKVGTHSLSDFNTTFYVDFGNQYIGGLGAFAPFYLTGEDPSQEEEVLEYHVSFLSGDEHMRGFYYNGDYGNGSAAINMNWNYINGPMTAKFRIDMVSEHYWASQTVQPVIADVRNVSVDLVSADVYVPVNVMTWVTELYQIREFVKIDPAPTSEYTCSLQIGGEGRAETDQYLLEGWSMFTPKEAGDYPMTLNVYVREGLNKEFEITVHATAETQEAYIEGDAPLTAYGERKQEEEAQRLQEQMEAERARIEQQVREIAQRTGQDPDSIEMKTAAANDASYIYHLENGQAVIDYIQPSGNTLTVADKLDGNPVVMISEMAANMCYNVTSLTLPEGIREVGRYAFSYLPKVEAIHLPESLEKIGDGAFGACFALKEITLPSGLKKENIGHRAFTDCGLEDIVLADGTSLAAVSLEAARQGGQYDNGVLMSSSLDGWIYFLREDGAAGIGGYQGEKREDMVVPEALGTHPVREITAKAFEGSSMKSVLLPEGLETIGEMAFSNSGELASVTLPSTLKSIGSKAFAGVAAAEITMPEGITDVPADWFVGAAFTDATGTWTYRTLADGSAVICGYTYAAKLDFPAEVDGKPVTKIEKPENADGDKNKVKQVVIAEGVKEIGDDAFRFMQKLSKVTLPSTLERIGEGAFYSCAFTSVSLPEGLQAIGKEAFAWNKLKEVTVPLTVTEIGDEAFACNNTSMIKKITFLCKRPVLGESLFGGLRQGDKKMGYYSHDVADEYYKVPTLTLVCYPGSTPDILYQYNVKKQYPKWGAEGIRTAPADKVLPAGLYKPEDDVYELIIPEGVEEISDEAFANLLTLCKVKLPSTLKKIGAAAFMGNPGLQEIALPKGLESIGKGCFGSCMALKSVTIPEGITEIPDLAFAECINLSKLTLPKAGLVRIGSMAFYDCESLASVKTGKDLQAIGDGAFAFSGLKSFAIPDSVTELGVGAFRADYDLASLTLPAGLTEIPDSLCEGCYNLKSIKIPAGVTRIGDAAFKRCRLIAKIDLPEGLLTIGDGAFEQNTQSVQIAYTQTKGKQTYSRLASVTLPASLQSLGKDAFACCDALKTVNFAEGIALEEIREDAFAMCVHLPAITLPDSVKTVGKYAFVNCLELKEVNLGNGVEKLEEQAFLYDSALVKLTVPASLSVIGEKVLEGHGPDLEVICPEGSAMEKYLQENAPDVKITRP